MKPDRSQPLEAEESSLFVPGVHEGQAPVAPEDLTAEVLRALQAKYGHVGKALRRERFFQHEKLRNL